MASSLEVTGGRQAQMIRNHLSYCTCLMKAPESIKLTCNLHEHFISLRSLFILVILPTLADGKL